MVGVFVNKGKGLNILLEYLGKFFVWVFMKDKYIEIVF